MKLTYQKIQVDTIGKVRFLFYQNQSYLTNIQILTNVGSTAEVEKENYGLAHILEHMFFKGSKKRPASNAITRSANNIGAKMNAYTSFDHTSYYITVLNEVFEEGFDILADMYLNPLFPETEFIKELNPILSELREKEDDPDSYLIEKSFESYFGDSYHPIIGTEQSIKGAKVSQMHEFKNDFYGGDNCLVAVVGGISKERALKAVDKFFHKTTSKQKTIPKKPDYNTKELKLTKAGIREAYCNYFFPALPSEHPQRFKQDMMNYLLGGNESGLLFERIREELGMSCYGIYSWIMRNQPFEILGISCGISPNEMDKLHEEILGILKKISTERLDLERLERGKASLRTSIAARSETSSGLNSMLALPLLRGEEEHPVEKMLRELDAITIDDILEQAESTLKGPMLRATLLPE